MTNLTPPLIVREPDGSLWLNITEAQADALRNRLTILPNLLRVSVGSLQIETRDGIRSGCLLGHDLRVIVDAIVMSVTEIDLHADMNNAVTATLKFMPQADDGRGRDAEYHREVERKIDRIAAQKRGQDNDCPSPIIADAP